MLSEVLPKSTIPLGFLMVGVTVSLAVGGMALFRRYIRPHMSLSEEMNNDVIFFASAINAFYGLTLGLIAVGVWRNYNSVQDIVSAEASVIAALFRDVSAYPEPIRTSLQEGLREHTKHIIERAWPAQREGILLDEGTVNLTRYQQILYSFEPKTISQQMIHGEALRVFNEMSALRRQRVEAVKGGLPTVMWMVVMIGAVLSITVTYLLEIAPKTHYILVSYLSTFTGLVIFVTYGLDHPLTGIVAIEPTAYELVLQKHISLISSMTQNQPTP